MMGRARRRTWLGSALIGVAVLALLGWAADWGARITAEAQVRHAIEQEGGLQAAVDVDVSGWFFLPQVARGDYQHVVVTLRHARAQGLRIRQLRTDLYDVHVPLRRIVNQDVRTVLIDRTEERALLSYEALNDYLASRGSNFRIARGTSGEVSVTTHLDVAGRSLPVSADAKVSPGRDYVDVVPTQVHTGSSILDTIGDAVLKLRLAFRIPMQPLPFGQTVLSVDAGADGLAVVARGGNVAVTRQGVYDTVRRGGG